MDGRTGEADVLGDHVTREMVLNGRHFTAADEQAVFLLKGQNPAVSKHPGPDITEKRFGKIADAQ